MGPKLSRDFPHDPHVGNSLKRAKSSGTAPKKAGRTLEFHKCFGRLPHPRAPPFCPLLIHKMGTVECMALFHNFDHTHVAIPRYCAADDPILRPEESSPPHNSPLGGDEDSLAEFHREPRHESNLHRNLSSGDE